MSNYNMTKQDKDELVELHKAMASIPIAGMFAGNSLIQTLGKLLIIGRATPDDVADIILSCFDQELETMSQVNSLIEEENGEEPDYAQKIVDLLEDLLE